MQAVVKRLQKVKRTLFAHAPYLRQLALSTALHLRRTLRIPHQSHYAALSLIRDDPDGVWLDIGANHGQSIESIRLYKANRVISFEANPVMGEELKARYPDNEIHAVALGNACGEFTLYIPAYKHAAFYPRATLERQVAKNFIDSGPVYWFNSNNARIDEVVCQVRTLDSFNLAPSLIKIDVEGMELQVIEGGMSTIATHLPILIVESVTPVIMQRLSPLGYTMYGYQGHRLLENVKGIGDAFLVPESKRAMISN